MKIPTLPQILSVQLSTSIVLGAALLLAASVNSRAASVAELLEKGIYTEETKGEPEAAARIYRRIVNDPDADRMLAAKAQLRLGLCELKLGNQPQAISALEKLTVEFPDKETLATVVGHPMPQLLDEMVRQIQENYIKEVDGGELMQTAIRAIIGKLDANSGFLRTNDLSFVSTNELAELSLGIAQKLAGIGACLRWDDSNHVILVESLLPDSPALRGGLHPGDRLVEVNGERLSQTNTLESVVKLLRGTPGTSVTTGVKRASVDEVVRIELIRDTVRLPSVLGDQRRPDSSWEFMLDEPNRVGYLRLTLIGKESPTEMEAALRELQGRGMQSLILDLRNNPGGTLSEAVAVADLFVDSGRIVTVKGRTGEQAFDAKPEGTFSGFDIVLLVNQNTASAAEIVAACLQDHHRGVVVGERTFGQGLVRSLIELKGDAGALKLPVAAYYRPSGKNMNRFPNSKDSDDWGVRPDEGMEVKMSDDECKAYQKFRFQRDVLNSPVPATLTFQDQQLQKALDYLRARPGQ